MLVVYMCYHMYDYGTVLILRTETEINLFYLILYNILGITLYYHIS